MTQLQLSKWLKIIVVGMAFCGVLLYGFVVPEIGREIVKVNPDHAHWYVPWLVIVSLTGVPCYVVLGYAWRIAADIGSDQSFTPINARRLKHIAHWALADVSFFLVANAVMLLLNMNHFGVLLMSGFIFCVGVAFSVVAAGLSHLVEKASAIREENEGTI